MSDDKLNKRKCRMVLFELEEALGNYVQKHAKGDVLNLSTNKVNTDLVSVTDAVESAYLDDIFKFSLAVSKDTADYSHIVNLYNKFKVLDLFQVRNASAHPTRPFNVHYWYKLATVASDPSIHALELTEVTNALVSAESGQLIDPPEDWLEKYNFKITNNLPERVEHSITGLVGRNKEIQVLKKNLKNERLKVNAIVAPGGMGKTALALELLSDIVRDPCNSEWCDGVFFSSMKTEKLTSEGVISLTAAETIDELKEELTHIFSEYYDADYSNFEEVIDSLKNQKILLFLDNLETLLRDSIDAFEELNESLPVSWQVLITSRITVPHKVIPLEELSETSSVDLAKRYIASRDIIELSYQDIKHICSQCFYNPLAIRLTLDLIMNGGEIPNSISVAKRDISEFSFSNLIDCLDRNELKVLECIFVEHSSTRQSIHSILKLGFDDIAASISKLSKTSLIDRNIDGDNENYNLISSVRELLLRTPKDLSLRSEINERYTDIIGKAKEVDLNQMKSNTRSFHITYIPDGVSNDLKVLCTELFKLLKLRFNSVDVMLGRKGLSSEKLTKMYKTFIDSKSAYENYALYHRSMAMLLSQLRDSKEAKNYLEKAIKVDPKDYASYLLLGRLLMNNSEYLDAYNLYNDLLNLLHPDEADDEMYARSLYNGLYLSLLYQNDYQKIIDVSTKWKELKVGKSTIGLLRATAYKRISEKYATNELSLDEFLSKMISAVGIISEVYRDFGHFKGASDVGAKIIDEFCYHLDRLKHVDDKRIDQLLNFCEINIREISSSVNDDVSSEVKSCLNKLIDFDHKNNPFNERSWRLYLNQTDPGKINKEEAIDIGLTIATVDKNVKRKDILFSYDQSGNRYFSHLKCYKGTNTDNWYNLERDDEIAIRIDYSIKGELPVSSELYIIE
ncbi:Transcription activator gutR [Photobacterium marinum]|uniref:Transcription activator gutR n=1 Tax=Photobacterium marinum TaxID=1056511 RepID=L8J8F2_9GAMM|nr:ATP-binding protein [Photobacterium marinum]ELR63727.1 Transcription activator gutR [Photobacterium marinum]